MSHLKAGGTGVPRSAWSSYVERRYTILFYSLVFTTVAGPLAATVGLDGRLLEIALGLNLLAAIPPMASRWSAQRLLAALVAVALLGRLVTLWLDPGIFPALSLGFWSVLALLAAASALMFALRATTIDSEHIYAALSAYLLVGLFFGVLYWVLAQGNPDAFAAGTDFTRVSAMYFSFVTLATLGYGDIVPRTDLARGLAIIEGIGGQLFLAVFVARLVSLFRSGR